MMGEGVWLAGGGCLPGLHDWACKAFFSPLRGSCGCKGLQ